MKRTLLVLSLLLAACQPPPAPAGVPLLVAGADLPLGHVLVAGDLQRAELPPTHATAGAARPEDLDALLGRQLRVPLNRGDTLLRGAAGPVERRVMPETIVERRRALTLPVAGANQLGESALADLVIELENPDGGERVVRRMRQLRVLGLLPPVATGQPFRVTLEMLPAEAEVVAQSLEVASLRVERTERGTVVADAP